MERENEKNKIDLYCIIHDVVKNIWMAVCIGLAASFLIYVVGKIVYKPTYTSTTTFVVSSKSSTNSVFSNKTQTTKMVDVFKSVMDSDILKKKVTEKMELETFPGTIDVSAVSETNLLTVSLQADSPQMAFRLLKNMLIEFPEVGEKVLGEVVLQIFEEPSYPSVPDNIFSGRSLMKKMFCFVFAIGVVVLSLISYFKDTVKNKKEVSVKLDTKLFGTLYHERQYKTFIRFLKKEKTTLMLTEPSVSFGFCEGIKKIATKLSHQMKKQNAKIVLITSTGDGEGKTTVALNLAQALAQRSKKVLLIDGNLRKPVIADKMGIESERYINWGEAIRLEKNMDEVIFTPEGVGFQALMNDAPVPKPVEILWSPMLKTWMNKWKKDMDVIIIDSPPVKKRSDTEILARLSDVSLLVVKQNMVPTKYINDAIDMLKGYGSGLLGCVFNDILKGGEVISYGYDYGYGYGYGGYYRYGKYERYGKYGKYGKYDKQDKSEET